MSIDLKAPLDAVNAAREAYESKAAEVAAWMAEKQGTDEWTQEALALQTKALDDAEQNYAETKAAYERLVKANQPSDVSKLFVPVTQPSADDEKPTAMKRADWQALNPTDREAFIKGGGKLED